MVASQPSTMVNLLPLQLRNSSIHLPFCSTVDMLAVLLLLMRVFVSRAVWCNEAISFRARRESVVVEIKRKAARTQLTPDRSLLHRLRARQDEARATHTISKKRRSFLSPNESSNQRKQQQAAHTGRLWRR